MHELTLWAEKEIVEQNEIWSQHKVTRSDNIYETISSIKEIYDERFYETYEIDEIERYLKCDVTITENVDNVNKYKEVLNKCIYNICDALDNVDECDLCSATDEAFSRPRKAHQMMHYQLEKIFCYLNDDGYGDIEWGLNQADAFSKEFAKKWVVIKPYEMSFNEIKLLTSVACYLEYKEQNPEEE